MPFPGTDEKKRKPKEKIATIERQLERDRSKQERTRKAYEKAKLKAIHEGKLEEFMKNQIKVTADQNFFKPKSNKPTNDNN